MHKGINTTCDEGQTMIPVAGSGFDDRPRLYSMMPMNSGKDFKARAVDVAQPLMAGGQVNGDQGGGYGEANEGLGITLDGTGPLSRSQVQAVALDRPQDSAVRRLTPEECEKLQGFQPDYTNIPWRGKPTSPDGPRYKALGNSFAVPVVRWIGRRIQMAEEA